MIRSIFLISEYGGTGEDRWEITRNFGYLTYEEAENKLLKKGWKKYVTRNGMDVTYDNPNMEHYYYSPQYARINEHKFYDRNFNKESV